MYRLSIHFKYVGRPWKPTNYRCASSYCVVVNGLKLKLCTIENLFTGFSLRFFRLRFQYLFYMERCQFQFLHFLWCQSLHITERIGWKNLDSRFISVAVAVYLCVFFFFIYLTPLVTVCGKNIILKLCFDLILSSLRKHYKMQQPGKGGTSLFLGYPLQTPLYSEEAAHP